MPLILLKETSPINKNFLRLSDFEQSKCEKYCDGRTDKHIEKYAFLPLRGIR